MIRLLLCDASVFTNINDQAIEPFGLHRGVHLGCPVAPHLFIIVVEALTATVKMW